MKKAKCSICYKGFNLIDLRPLLMVRDAVWDMMSKETSLKREEGYVCNSDYQSYQIKHLKQLLKEERGKISGLEQQVIDSFKSQELLTEDTNKSLEESLTFGERVADKVSSFGGSWKFILLFFSFMLGWMFLNTYVLLQDQFDPYPYILLNLTLSCLAAVQAPIIMMSQNRRAERDHIQAENDYKVNLKAELQIRHLNMKLDRFINLYLEQTDPSKED